MRLEAGDAAGLSLMMRDGCSEWAFAPTSNDQTASLAQDGNVKKAMRRPPQKDLALAFVIRETGGASGLGAYAARAIKQGECIIAESPLVQWTLLADETRPASTAIAELVAGLDTVNRESYFELCQNPKYGSEKHAHGIWCSNAYPSVSPLEAAALSRHHRQASRTGAVFARVCRFNHSCTPNSYCAWNARLGKQTIHAMRDIPPGAEILVTYLAELGADHAKRSARLATDFGFVCECATCSLTTTERAESDRRRQRIGALGDVIREAVPRKRADAISLVEERLKLMEEEGIGGTSYDTIFAASAYCRLVGDRASASLWASRAADCARLALGCDSEEFVKLTSLVGNGRGFSAVGGV